jgi:hypothetical protein
MTPAVRFAVLYATVDFDAAERPRPVLMLERTEYTRAAFQSMLDRAGVDPGHPLRAWVAQERWPGDLWCVPHEAVAGIGAVACVAPQSSTVPRLEPLTRTAEGWGGPGRPGPRKISPEADREIRESLARMKAPPQVVLPYPSVGLCTVGPPVLPGEQVILGGVAVGEPLSADGLANLDRAVADDYARFNRFTPPGAE